MDPVTGLSTLGNDVTKVILVFLGAILMWRLAKAAFKGSGAAAFGGVCLALGAIYYMAHGGIADIGTVIRNLIQTYGMGQK